MINSLNEEWQRINFEFFSKNRRPVVIKTVAGVYTQIYNQTLTASGFGTHKNVGSVLLREQRLNLLADRYIDQPLWDQCIGRAVKNPTSNSHTFLFNRKEGPKAGGCLLSIVLINRNREGGYELMISSRAEEVTMALLADIHFVRRCMTQIEECLNVNLKLNNIPIKWHIGVCYQNRTFIPGFIYDVEGSKGLKEWLTLKKRSEWEQVCIDHSNKMLRDDGVTGARKLWGRRMREWLNVKA